MKTPLLVLLALTWVASVFGAEPKPLNVGVGQEFTLKLESNASTGYQWLLATPLDEKLLKQSGRVYERPVSRQTGATGCEVLKFKAVAEGQTEIKLKYARLWEKDSNPARQTNFVVVITKLEAKR